MQILKILSAMAFGGKRNIAIIGMIAVYVLNKCGVSVGEADVEQLILSILGAIGVIHGVWKSDTMQKIVSGIKAKSDASKSASTESKK